MKSPPDLRGALVIAGGATLLASACCVMPLALVLLGVTGAWMAYLHAMNPAFPVLIAVSLAAQAFSWARVCGRAGSCTVPACRSAKALLILISAATVALLSMPLVAPYFY